MKKFFTLMALVGLAFGANAQRHCNLIIKHATLTTPGGRYLGDSAAVPFIATIQNIGTDSVKVGSDSVVFYVRSYDIYTHSFGFPANAVFFRLSIKAGDSATVVDTSGIMPMMFKWHGFASDSTGPLCLGVYALNRSADSVATDTASASIGCATVTYVDVRNTQKITAGYSVYPNPVQNDLNMDLYLNSTGDVVVRVLDVTGRAVLTEDKGKLGSGDHKLRINTSSLQNGVYIYQLMVNNETSTGRFSVSK